MIYTCVANKPERCRKDGRDDLIAGMERYCDTDDFNKCFYHATGEEVKELLKAVLKDAGKLRESCKDSFGETDGYQLLLRCINEQTVEEDGELRLRVKEDGAYGGYRAASCA